MDETERDFVVMRLDDAARAMVQARSALMEHGGESPDVAILLANIETTGAQVESCKDRAEKL